MGGRNWTTSRAIFRRSAQRIMKCLCSGEQFKTDAGIRIPESLATRDYSASGYSSHTGEDGRKIDTGNIEEAESSLREGGCLNYEEARALLGRLEYHRGNVEAALRVFDGIDIAAVAPKMKLSIARRAEHHKFRSYNNAAAPMSIHAVSLLFEAIFLKAKSLQDLGRFKEAAQSCNIILDTVESALPQGLPENFGTDSKLQEMLSKAVELLPELWKLAGFFHETILTYRRALLSHWNLDEEVTAKIQKEFAIFLLYSGSDASPPNLRSQSEGSFIPRNNIEEAILLLMILLRKFALKKVEWDPSIIDHLTFALSVSGELKALANQVEELLPGVMKRQERYYTLALSYLGEGDQSVALNLLKKILSSRENPNCVKAILLASKICTENRSLMEDGASYARKALDNLNMKCSVIGGVANCLLGRSLLSQARPFASDAEKIARQSEAFEALEHAKKMTESKDYEILYNISLEYAEQRKLDRALRYAEQLLKLEAGSNVKVWILLARIFSAQKQFVAAEAVIDAALDQTPKWGHGELLRLKAKIQIAQGKLKEAFETYTYLLAVLQLRAKSSGVGMKLLKGLRNDRSLEIETWHDLANIYTGLSQWKDAEICLSKSRAITPFSASRWHATGKLYDAQGRRKEALGAYAKALEIEPTHVPSLISTAIVLRQLGGFGSLAIARSFLTDALMHDRTNHSAWFNLGLLYKTEGGKSTTEAVECFQAAAHFEDSAPVEPFR